MLRRLAAQSLVVLAALGSPRLASNQGRNAELVIAVTETPVEVPSPTYPGAVLWQGRAANVSGHAVTLQAVRGPGGYAGDAIHFECTLEQWTPSPEAWVMEPRPISAQYSRAAQPFTLQASQVVAACSRAFGPSQGAPRARFRFRLWADFARIRRSWTSDEFETTMRPIR